VSDLLAEKFFGQNLPVIDENCVHCDQDDFTTNARLLNYKDEPNAVHCFAVDLTTTATSLLTMIIPRTIKRDSQE
jgi:hypothetical protein